MMDMKRLQRWRKYRELGEPDEALHWCSKCWAHTYPGKIRVKTEHGSSMNTVCGQCKLFVYWLVPHDFVWGAVFANPALCTLGSRSRPARNGRNRTDRAVGHRADRLVQARSETGLRPA